MNHLGLGLFLLQIAQAIVGIAKPGAIRFWRMSQAAMTFGWILFFVYLLQAGNWVVLRDLSGSVAEKQAEVAAMNHYVFFYGLIGVIVGTTVQLGFEIRRIVKPVKD